MPGPEIINLRYLVTGNLGAIQIALKVSQRSLIKRFRLVQAPGIA